MTNEDEVEALLVSAENAQGDPQIVDRVVARFEDLVGRDPTARHLYACAYAWYVHPARIATPRILDRVDELLQHALRLAPADYACLLFLGHNAYDQASYDRARTFFLSARAVAPRSYFGLKSCELVACCDVKLGNARAALDSITAFAREATLEAYEPEDIWPRELARALETAPLPEELSPEDQRVLREALVTLDEAGNWGNWLGAAVARTSARRR